MRPRPKRNGQEKKGEVKTVLYKRVMADTSAIRQHAAHTTDQLASPSCWQEPYQKVYLLAKSVEEFSGGKSQEKGPVGSKKKTNRKNHEDRQKNKRGDSKVEPNDSPEIPDREETSDVPGLLSGLSPWHDLRGWLGDHYREAY